MLLERGILGHLLSLSFLQAKGNRKLRNIVFGPPAPPSQNGTQFAGPFLEIVFSFVCSFCSSLVLKPSLLMLMKLPADTANNSLSEKERGVAGRGKRGTGACGHMFPLRGAPRLKTPLNMRVSIYVNTSARAAMLHVHRASPLLRALDMCIVLCLTMSSLSEIRRSTCLWTQDKSGKIVFLSFLGCARLRCRLYTVGTSSRTFLREP